jgi:hypothetical protein
MYRIITSFLVFSIILTHARAQSVSINTDASQADPSAMLEVKSASKGMLCPRMTELERTSINLPAKSLLVYQTDGTEGYYYNSGTAAAPNWQRLSNDKSTVAFSATSSAGQSYSAGSYVKVLFPTEEYDESGNFIPGATSEFTAPSAGIYHFDAMIVTFGSSGARYDLAIFVNNVQKKNTLDFLPGSYFTLQLSVDLKLAANDRVDLRIFGAAPGQLNPSSPQWTWINGRKVN